MPGERDPERLEEGLDFFCGPESDQQPVCEVSGMRIVRCRRCGLVLVNPRLSGEAQFDEVYVEGYGKGPSAAPTGLLRRAKRGLVRPFRGRTGHDRQALFVARSLRRLQGRAPERMRLLEVGSWVGKFIEAAKQRYPGWDITGVEPSAHGARVCREEKGLNVHHGTLADVQLPAESFDVVHLWHVLEHLPDPPSTMRLVQRCLKSGGVLTLRTPNCESLASRRQGARWRNWDPLQHLYHFTYDTLDRLLTEAGLKRVWPRRITFWTRQPSTLLIAATKARETPVEPAG